MIIGSKRFDTENQHHIMGILNLTPDSFSDGGRYNELDTALAHVTEMIAQGANIIDVGGMSTRPGHTEITIEEEIERVLPVLKALRERFKVVISLDTYRSEVVVAAAPYIDMVNDIYGLRYDELMADVIANYDLSVCIMAHKSYEEDIHPMEDPMDVFIEETRHMDGKEYIKKVIEELEDGIHIALKAGISKDKIMIDGGVGFGKTYEQNLMVIHHTNELSKLGYPLLMATSNKGFMGAITGSHSSDRSYETITTTVMGAMHGASFFRVHDVAGNKRALDMFRAISTCSMPK